MTTVDVIQKSAPSQAAIPARRTKRSHSEEFKQSVVQACAQPGASVAGVALTNGVNANLVRKWCLDRNVVPSPKVRIEIPQLLPVNVEAKPERTPAKVTAPASRSGGIDLELYGARLTVRAGTDLDTLRAVLQILRDVQTS
jgi:transposase-like protein